ncbi:type II toxin-antitoxin system MqsR family toxin [Gemmatimonadota bacterium]
MERSDGKLPLREHRATFECQTNVASDPTYDLELIKRLVTIGQWKPTKRALENASSLCFEPRDIRDCVLGLEATDFDRTYPSETVSETWQDVYKPTYCEVDLYVKVQISHESLVVVISFHDCD